MFASVDPGTAKIKFCNQTLSDRLGYSKAELTGKPLKELYHPQSHDEMERQFRLFVSEGHAECDHLQLITARGDIIDVSLRVSSLRDDNGNVIESRSIWRDASLGLQVERLQLELRLQEAQRMESLALLAGGIAHDFNNMLAAILGNATLSVLELPIESPVRAKLQSIEIAAQRAADLTKQLMAYSGSANQEQKYFDLSKVVAEMGHLLSVAISRKVVLKFDLADDPIFARGDVTQIRQIIMNLLTNGSDAIGDRSGIITIRTGLIMADHHYLTATLVGAGLAPGYYSFLEVSDTGVGISAENQRRMFDPFFTNKSKGHGLGLAAVLGIVKSHGGTLRVYSETGNGTTIRILLPAVEYTENEKQELQALRKGDGERILLVDDDEHVLAITKQMLERHGFEVLLASDGREAINTYCESAKRIDLVLMDITMPHLDGIAACKAITAHDADAKVILMSGYSKQQATSTLTGQTFAGFLQKPFLHQSLLKTVLNTLDGLDPE